MRDKTKKQTIFVSYLLGITLILSSLLPISVTADEAGKNVWAQLEQKGQGYYEFIPEQVQLEMIGDGRLFYYSRWRNVWLGKG
jgi:hypothetical protein